SIRLLVVLHRSTESGPANTWIVRERDSGVPDLSPPERFLTESYIESLPSSEHLWSFLNQTEVSVVSDSYDTSGLRSAAPFLFGVRGSSWSQNQGLVNGQTVSNPSGDGMLIFPDMSAMEAIIYTVGDS